ncbi:S41 family peptidase [Fibrobacter sp.]|uniref:S41 family peptidase n=1 Tax=Fibrobacter sp. TaxID=35828 RepID=UPI0025C4F650|nr:S41 family peptidase [Fibrobacter sp.]MCI6438295.1 S41 family peptidase [Fibrobacter sp.]MDD7496988.1 S41 family peptidase [Fibrobacter sp.]MDY5723385.1 S41 family peptidase [Fibrobacter sp.]
MNLLRKFSFPLFCISKRLSLVFSLLIEDNSTKALKRLVPFISSLVFLTACSDFFEPVESTPEPTEYSYNYWLLKQTYLFEDELPQLDENGDSVQELYNKLSDPFTRYIPPSKSEATITHINTSIVPGDVGMEYEKFPQKEYPLVIYRVYPEGPAGRAGIKRYGNIMNANGVDIVGENAFEVYDSILTYSKDISLTVAYTSDTISYNLTKEDVYAPTIFLDTLNGIPIITITSFKLNTADQKNGSFGELKTYLDSTQNTTEPRLINLRNNPGGHVSHCIAMADLFIKEGILSTRTSRDLSVEGKTIYRKNSQKAKAGDSGEKGKFVLLVNKGSASCSEIFAAALQEAANIPVAGETTYGKGIGQSTWKTMDGGLAIITNWEFLTPKGNSYHKKGVVPDFPCESATLSCGIKAIQNYYGTAPLLKSRSGIFDKEPSVLRRYKFEGGSIENSNF